MGFVVISLEANLLHNLFILLNATVRHKTSSQTQKENSYENPHHILSSK